MRFKTNPLSLSAKICCVTKREINLQKATLEAWKLNYFGPSVEHTVTTISSDRKEISYSRLKPLLECTLKHQRNRMSNLYAENEKNLEKTSGCLRLADNFK